MQLFAVAPFQALLTRAQGHSPIGTHLDIFVPAFDHFIVESVATRIGITRRPYQCLVRICEATPTKIRHRIGFSPDHVIEDPKAEILHYRADAENIMIGAYHPDGGGRLHDAAASGEPD